MEWSFAFALGVLAGIITFWLVARLRERDTAALAQELVRQADAAKTKEVELLTSNMRDSVKALTSELITGGVRQLNEAATDSLSRYTSENRTTLDTKRELIDQSLQSMNEKLEQVSALVSTLEKDREQKFGELSQRLVEASSATTELRGSADQLRNILSNPTARGQWGERLAEDVLRTAGLVDGINYRKQLAMPSGTKPDFTFFLPNGQLLNMDVKFPLTNFLASFDCASEDERKSCADRFRRDVLVCIKQVRERGYIDPAEGTVDYAILFVPNERVLSFLNECDATVMDGALKSRVVICSPFTLYAVLVVIRQAMDNFNFTKATSEMIELLAAFNKQWDEFVKAFEGVESKIDNLQEAFTTLTTTRRKGIDRVLTKIDEVRVRRGIPAESGDGAIDSP